MIFLELAPTVFANSFVSLAPIEMPGTSLFTALEPTRMIQDPFVVIEPSAFLQGATGLTDAQFAAAYGKYQLMYPSAPNSYSFKQTALSNLWVIPHNLTFVPSVTITDLTGAVVITEIVYVTPTLIHSISIFPFSGFAHLS